MPLRSRVQVQVIDLASLSRGIGGRFPWKKEPSERKEFGRLRRFARGPFSGDRRFLPFSDAASNGPERFAGILAVLRLRLLRRKPFDGVFHQRLHLKILIEIERQYFSQYDLAVGGHRFVACLWTCDRTD